MKKERILFLDGLKGFACLGVFTHHFFLSYFPASYFGEEAAIRTVSGFEAKLSYSPYAFFINGNFWVCLFLLISAFLFSEKIFRLKETNESGAFPALSDILLKRYIRLMIPVLLIGIFDHFLVELLTVTHLNYVNKENALSIIRLLYHAMIKTWIAPDSSVQGPFWMLHYLLFGSYLAVLIALATPKKSRWTPLIHLFLALALGMLNRYYAGIVFGVMICYEYKYGKILPFLQRKKILGIISGILLLSAGLFLGAYPTYVKPDNIYRIFNMYTLHDPDAAMLFHCIGSACLLISFFLLKALASLFSTAPFQFLGKFSFSIYLIHNMLLEYLGYFVMHRLSAGFGNYSLAGIVSYLFLTIVLFAMSFICLNTVERLGNFVCKKLFS